MAHYNLYKWSVTNDQDPYTAPECRHIHLTGVRMDEGEEESITTTRVLTVNGRFVTTRSGNTYYLKNIDPNYLDWMKANNMEYDEAQPIKVK